VDSRLLEYFLRVAELGSINKAAADLHLSQPALSRHIASLEHEMGTQLFNRTRGGITLTDSGKLLSDRARPLLRQFAILKEQVAEKVAGQLAIGIPPSLQYVFTSAFVREMTTQYPGVFLRVYEGMSHVLRDYIFAGLLDLCIIPFNASPAVGYRQTAIVREPLVLVGRAQEGLQPEDPAPLSRLDGMRLVLPGRPNVLREQIEHMLRRKGMEFRIAVETDTLTLCLELAQQGMGYAVVPACAIYQHSLGNTISWAPVQGMFVTWALLENRARTHSQAVREGRKVVIHTVAESLAARTWFGAERVGSSLPKEHFRG
jgi:LysR family nitrogen assimilation transcriptional regulator